MTVKPRRSDCPNGDTISDAETRGICQRRLTLIAIPIENCQPRLDAIARNEDCLPGSPTMRTWSRKVKALRSRCNARTDAYGSTAPLRNLIHSGLERALIATAQVATVNADADLHAGRRLNRLRQSTWHKGEDNQHRRDHELRNLHRVVDEHGRSSRFRDD